MNVLPPNYWLTQRSKPSERWLGSRWRGFVSLYLLLTGMLLNGCSTTPSVPMVVEPPPRQLPVVAMESPGPLRRLPVDLQAQWDLAPSETQALVISLLASWVEDYGVCVDRHASLVQHLLGE